MTDYNELARRAENGELTTKGKALRGSAAAESAQHLLMDATGANSLDEALAAALDQHPADHPRTQQEARR